MTNNNDSKNIGQGISTGAPMVVNYEFLAGLSPYQVSEYDVRITNDQAAFTGSGAVNRVYKKDVAGSARLSSYAYKRFLEAVEESQFFSIKTRREVMIIDSSMAIISMILPDGRVRTIRSTEVAADQQSWINNDLFSRLEVAIHTLTGLNEWLANTFDDGKYLIQEQEEPEQVKIKSLVSRARQLSYEGEHKKAIDSYEEAIRLDPANIELATEKCDFLRQIKSYDPLAEAYKALLRLDRSQTHLLNDIGQALHRIERFEEAVEWYDRAIAARPKDALPMFNKGLSLLELKKYKEAIECFDYVSSDNWRAYFEKGLCLVELEQFKDAIGVLKQGLALYPSYPFGLVNMARALNGLGRFEEALRYADEALTINPNHSWFWTVKGVSQSGLGQTEKALQSLEKAIELEPRNSEAKKQKARILAGRMRGHDSN